MRLLIVVTHLLGTGHLSRALTIGRAFSARGHRVTIASGGAPVGHLDQTGLDMRQLPPLRSDGTNFTTLLRPDGTIADAQYMSDRRAALCAIAHDGFDIVLTELFPFGRRVLRAEFLALLETVRAQNPRPLVLASIRDILNPPSKPARAEWTESLLDQYYDGVLVHGDPAIADMSLSWPVTPNIARKLHYTGYVAPPAANPHPDRAGAGEVLVSAGGGSVGHALFDAARAAAHLDPDRVWRLLVGGGDAEEHRAALAAGAPPNLRVDPVRPDFRQMLRHAACAVGQCGYNTTLDILQAGTPALFVPFDAGNEVEQTLRARGLSALPSVAVLESAAMTPEKLAKLVAELIAQGPRPTQGIRDNGAADSVRLCEEMIGLAA